MKDQWLTEIRSQVSALAGRVDLAGAPADREAIKREIIALFKQIDGALTDLGQLKEDIRVLVDRYKQASSVADTSPAPQFNGDRPAVHADHLGASTYIEKGWSLISLGDYPGAIQALDKALALSPGAVQAQSLLGWAQQATQHAARMALELVEPYVVLLHHNDIEWHLAVRRLQAGQINAKCLGVERFRLDRTACGTTTGTLGVIVGVSRHPTHFNGEFFSTKDNISGP